MFVHTYRFISADFSGCEKELGYFQARSDEEAQEKAVKHAKAQGDNPWCVAGIWDRDPRFFLEPLTLADLDD